MDAINHSCMRSVVECMGGSYFATSLRSCSKTLSRAVPPIPLKFDCELKFLEYGVETSNVPVCANMLSCGFVDVMYVYAARIGNLQMLVKAMEWGANAHFRAMRHASLNGHLEICKEILLIEPDAVEEMFYTALEKGRADVAEEAFKRMPPDSIDFYENVAHRAARSGLLSVCKAAVQKGARNYDYMLIAAANGRQTATFEYARELINAGQTRRGEPVACQKLYKHRFSREFKDLLVEALRWTYSEANFCRLCDFTEMCEEYKLVRVI